MLPRVTSPVLLLQLPQLFRGKLCCDVLCPAAAYVWQHWQQRASNQGGCCGWLYSSRPTVTAPSVSYAYMCVCTVFSWVYSWKKTDCLSNPSWLVDCVCVCTITWQHPNSSAPSCACRVADHISPSQMDPRLCCCCRCFGPMACRHDVCETFMQAKFVSWGSCYVFPCSL
jgi:hypothetical protein